MRYEGIFDKKDERCILLSSELRGWSVFEEARFTGIGCMGGLCAVADGIERKLGFFVLAFGVQRVFPKGVKFRDFALLKTFLKNLKKLSKRY